MYTTSHYATLPDLQLVAVDLDKKLRRRIPLSQASEACFDATGKKLFFVRPAYHRNVTKRYKGGTARKIWRFVEGSPEAEVLTRDYAGESHTPMWWKGRVYFITDRDGTMNLWSMDENGGDLKQHTFHSGWDVRDASLDGGRIVYQVGADLWLYDTATGEAREVPITLVSDLDQLREKWVKKPMEYLTSAHIHPNGERVVLTARGRVFVVPARRGRLVRASRRPGVRYRDAVFMRDGSSLLALSDETGELEFVRIPTTGVGEQQVLIRRAWFYWKSRAGEPYWNMQYAFRGHLVALCDHETASDGEAVIEGFRRLGLGKLIGTRTWGGEIWLSSVNRLSDGGLARAPMSGVYGLEGKWLIEGRGVEPDIEVDNLPHETFVGRDAQLDTAIDYLLEAIRKDPRPVPAPPPYPDKSFRYPERAVTQGPVQHSEH